MTSKNRAEEIRASMKNGATGPQAHREIVADMRIRIDAQTEIGKLGAGYDFNTENWGTDRRSLLNKRSELRRLHNTLAASTRQLVEDNSKSWTSEHDETYDARMNALAYLASMTTLIEMQLVEEEEQAGGSPSAIGATALRDSEGRRIGTVLSNQALRSRDQIANQLGATTSDGGEINLTDFFRGVAKMKTSEGVRNALSVGTDSAGGYTVPTVLLPGILNALVPASSMLNAGASVAILTDPGKSFTIAGIDTIPTAAWRNEAGAVAESQPAFRGIVITPRSLSFRFKVSRELLADSQNLEQPLRVAIAGAFAKELDRAGLRGSGTAPEIRGLLNTPNVNAIANGANGATPTNYSNFVAAWKEITTDNAPAPTAAILHPRDMATFANLVDTTGQPLRRPELLDSMRFLQTSQIPTNLTVGTSTNCSEIFVGDFSQFVFFMREGVTIQLATELYAETGEVGFFCHTRVDVAAMYAQAFAVITGVKP